MSVPAAADVFSPAVFTTTGRYVTCAIVNVWRKDLTATIQVIAADDGAVLQTTDVVLAPGEGDEYSSSVAQGQLTYCAFRGRFSAKSVRASALIQDLSTNVTYVAVPAQ